MYSQLGSGMGDTAGRPILDVDIFGIPAAFLHGIFAYQYGADHLVLEPSLPDGVLSLEQKFPARFGNISLFLSLSGTPPAPGPSPPGPAPSPPERKPWSCEVFGCTCQAMMDYYGCNSWKDKTGWHHGFGCAPKEAQDWWAATGLHQPRGMPGGCGGATKTNGSFCAGVGCTASNPCATQACKSSTQNGGNYTCDLCHDGQPASACTPPPPNAAPTMPNLPKVDYQWWQMPTTVEINGVNCNTCLNRDEYPRQVTLDFQRLAAAGPSVKIHISFGSNLTRSAPTADAGVAAQRRWDQAQAERERVSFVPGCALSPAADMALKNVSAFSAAMAKAGLASRFENAQAAAVREALNVSVTRCSRRASGAIGPIPPEPASWRKNNYSMGYNQTLAEAYFQSDQWGRIWTGLVNLMQAYEASIFIANTIILSEFSNILLICRLIHNSQSSLVLAGATRV